MDVWVLHFVMCVRKNLTELSFRKLLNVISSNNSRLDLTCCFAFLIFMGAPVYLMASSSWFGVKQCGYLEIANLCHPDISGMFCPWRWKRLSPLFLLLMSLSSCEKMPGLCRPLRRGSSPRCSHDERAVTWLLETSPFLSEALQSDVRLFHSTPPPPPPQGIRLAWQWEKVVCM